MKIVCLDLEGVLVPEIWVSLSEKTGINELKWTTREIPDYDQLMQNRLQILKKNKILAKDLLHIANELDPLEGAVDFLENIRSNFQVIILSDTFYDIAKPLFHKLKFPTIFCHNLDIDQDGFIINYNIRIKDHKRLSVEAFTKLNFKTIAVGDSYNDLSMLRAADAGILFRSTKEIKDNHKYYNCNSYNRLEEKIFSLADNI